MRWVPPGRSAGGGRSLPPAREGTVDCRWRMLGGALQLFLFNLTQIASVYGEPSGLTRDRALHMFVLTCFVC